MLNRLIERFGVDKLNTLTKYPSIPTYHALGEKGALLPDLTGGAGFPDRELCYVTEKVDGTNTRIIAAGDDYIIGSREELLFAKGDRFGNPSQGIVSAVRPVADCITDSKMPPNQLLVLYGEVYGGKISSAKQYTKNAAAGFRLFDLAVITTGGVEFLWRRPIEELASWREHNFKRFLHYPLFQNWCEEMSLPTTPLLAEIEGSKIPTDRAATLEWMQQFSETKAGLDHVGRAEGVVIRTADRSVIRKLRFEDYKRTKHRGGM